MTKPSSLRKRMSENAEPLTEGAQSQTASVLVDLYFVGRISPAKQDEK